MNNNEEKVKSDRDGNPFAVVCRVMSQLEDLFSSHNNESFIDTFYPKVIKEVNEENLTGDAFCEILLDRAESSNPEETLNFMEYFRGTMVLSSVYCCEVIKEFELKKDNDAWSLACDAKYWLGIALGMDSMISQIANGSKNLARQGGKARNARFDPMRDLAIKLAMENKFPSKRNAAKNIAPHVLKLSEELEVRLSPDQVQTTITGWLKDITFTSKRGM